MLGFSSTIAVWICDRWEGARDGRDPHHLSTALLDETDQPPLMTGRLPHLPGLLAAQDQTDPGLIDHQRLHCFAPASLSSACRRAIADRSRRRPRRFQQTPTPC